MIRLFLRQKRLAERFAYADQTSTSSSSSSSSVHAIRNMLQQVINDQTLMKEQLLRLNAASNTSSCSSSLSASDVSISHHDDEYVDNYTPKPKASLKSFIKKQAETSDSDSIVASLKNEKKTVKASRLSNSNTVHT